MGQSLLHKLKPNRDAKNKEEKKEIDQVKEKEIPRPEEVEQEISFPSLQKTLTLSFDNTKILKIHELSNKRIGILLTDSLQIYNSKNFKKLEKINLPVSNNNSDERVFDFIELKNSDLVLWSPKIILFYKISENKYSLCQNISKFKENKEEKDCNVFYSHNSERKKFEINSVYELTNGKLVCCHSFGLIIYNKKKEKYILESEHKMEIDVRKIIELDENKLILLQRYHYFYWVCSRTNYNSHTYSISTYDIKTKKLTELASNKVTQNDYFGYSLISYMIKNGMFLVRYGNRIDIYDIKNNMLLMNHDQEEQVIIKEIFDSGKYKILKDEMDIIFLCDYGYKFIIAKNVHDKVRIYTLQDSTLKYIEDFPFELEDLNEIIRLKNNTLLMYSDKKLIILNKK